MLSHRCAPNDAPRSQLEGIVAALDVVAQPPRDVRQAKRFVVEHFRQVGKKKKKGQKACFHDEEHEIIRMGVHVVVHVFVVGRCRV